MGHAAPVVALFGRAPLQWRKGFRMTYKIAALALIIAAVPAAPDGGVAPELAAEQGAPVTQVAPTDAATVPDPTVTATSTAAAPTAPPPVFDSHAAFSPTFSSGYYYASPYAGYTSLSYYGSIYTVREFSD